MAGEKTEKATPKRRKQARKEGQVARTPDLGGWATMLLLGLAMPTLLGREIHAWTDLMTQAFTATEHPTTTVALQLLGQGGRHALESLVVLGSMVMVVGVGSAIAQGGFALATKQVKPSLSKLNPIKGAKRLFGPQVAWEGVKVLVKSALVAVIVTHAIKGLMPLVGGLVPMDAVVGDVRTSALGLARTVAFAGLAMAGADYAMQRRRVGKQTRMTKDEVKQEHKQSEGDPLLKGAIRSRQLAASRNRMMAAIADADVVLVNPTHVAVALRYDPEQGAPRVVARGAGAIAARIRERAAEERIALVRDVPLARALYTSTRVGQTIPPELFSAVATVLAFVISRRTHGHMGGSHRTPRAEVDLPAVLPAGRRRKPSTALPAGR